jgi:membrane-associated phospholipid phosphatase
MGTGKIFIGITTMLLLGSMTTPARAQTRDVAPRDTHNTYTWRFFSGSGNTAFLIAGTLLPKTNPQKIRNLDALVTTCLLTQALKITVRERRPDGSTRNSFPSGHASAAFAIATMQPKSQQPLWYAGATLIGISRVKLNRHYTHDVVAGAALGYYTAREAQKRPLLFSYNGSKLTLTKRF